MEYRESCKNKTPLEICMAIAAIHEIKVSSQEADSIIWTHTGFPNFWDIRGDETPEDCMRRQLEEYFGETCSYCQDFASLFFKRKSRKVNGNPELTTRCKRHNALSPIEPYGWERITKEEFVILWIMNL
jgi:hypothetical protein